MGDADLMKELKETNRRLKDLSLPLGPVQDIEIEEIDSEASIVEQPSVE
jgi:hypothetical protein